jgi:hypothetical protein
METMYLKTTIATGWMCALCAVALVGHFTSGGLILLVALSVVPPIVVLRYWTAPVETLSQSIREVLREG